MLLLLPTTVQFIMLPPFRLTAAIFDLFNIFDATTTLTNRPPEFTNTMPTDGSEHVLFVINPPIRVPDTATGAPSVLFWTLELTIFRVAPLLTDTK